MIKMIATDIDGTIYSPKIGFSPKLRECVKELCDKGIKVVLVTGANALFGMPCCR